jgi:hypothetical protein
MTARPAASAEAMRPVPFWRRLLMALGIGLLATVAGSAAGAILLAVLGAVYEGWHVLRGMPAFVFYGVIFGPVLAWPVTLVVLPGIWLFVPLRHRRRGLWLAGLLAGAAVLTERVLTEAGLGTLSWVMVACGTLGGLVAGLVFGAFVPRSGAEVSAPPPAL